MTVETEKRLLELLESMDGRLKTIADATDYLRRYVEGIERGKAFERNALGRG